MSGAVAYAAKRRNMELMQATGLVNVAGTLASIVVEALAQDFDVFTDATAEWRDAMKANAGQQIAYDRAVKTNAGPQGLWTALLQATSPDKTATLPRHIPTLAQHVANLAVGLAYEPRVAAGLVVLAQTTWQYSMKHDDVTGANTRDLTDAFRNSSDPTPPPAGVILTTGAGPSQFQELGDIRTASAWRTTRNEVIQETGLLFQEETWQMPDGPQDHRAKVGVFPNTGQGKSHVLICYWWPLNKPGKPASLEEARQLSISGPKLLGDGKNDRSTFTERLGRALQIVGFREG